MKYITYLNILAKSIFTIAIFIFVREQSDYYIVPILTSLGFIIAGTWSLLLIKREFKINFKFQTLKTLKIYIKDSWHIFLSQLNISLFSSSNIIILGILTNNTVVGYYSAAEKIMRALSMLQVPITTALFPHMAQLLKIHKEKAILQLKKIITIGSLLYAIISVLVLFFAEDIIHLLYNNSFEESILVLEIIAFVPLTIFLNNIFGTQIMLNTGKQKEFSKILFVGAIINIFLCFILSYYFSYIGTAISLVIVEIYIMVGMLVSIKKEFNILIDKRNYI